ncbi:MAG TPA: hypothetical protein H9815_12560 [Candidatus Ruania gallistercoris]|uniref:Uncharacterized protein n=1 Tax=Candidatus Ruania gallistercoris TaxID=2838746 RepID=A0A9D2EFQ8_9MICO|nr:hypothetical protein [Candidatus Ruania gallistercoris]
MEIVYGIVLVLHLIGWALVLGGAVYGLRETTTNKGMLHGILTALIAGIIMVGLGSAGVAGPEPNNIKIGVKLVIALVVTAMVLVGSRKETVTKGFLGGVAGLTVLNVAIAVLW